MALGRSAPPLAPRANHNLSKTPVLLTATPMLTFTLLRLPYLRLDAVLSRSIYPGDWSYYRTGWYRYAIAILPVGILMIPQLLLTFRSKNHHLIPTNSTAISSTPSSVPATSAL
ncbi:MAG: hypothetical protein Q9221_002837 [Calogaya cf. arnoldii]